MRFSSSFIPTLREAPGDADIISAKLMQRAGMIRKLSSGVYEWLPLGLRVLKKVEQIIREEMNSVCGQEVWLPLLLPRELWEETGRWGIYGKELFRLKDRKNADFCLGPTHEEVITDLVRREVRSYRQLPLMLYQFGTKFRDEIRPRFGVMRAREFYMKDAYSFHTDEKDLERYYQEVFAAYQRICDRCGFAYRPVEATTGTIGGSFSHEFMVLAETGEEVIAWCDCGYGANTEKAECARGTADTKFEAMPMEEIPTPGMKSVGDVSKFLKVNSARFIKTLVYMADGKPVIALIRGDKEINEHKLQSVLGAAEVGLADEATIAKVTGAPVGFAGPMWLAEKVTMIADYSVEFLVNAVAGANKTDTHVKNVSPGRDFTPDKYVDLRVAKEGDTCLRCGKELKFSRGIEVGHAFKLGTKYSDSMKAQYLDADGKEKTMVMGCYGIGVSRIVAATIEQSHDENGIVWPMAIAPFSVVVVPVNWADETIRTTAESFYTELQRRGIETLMDDRDERAGIKFKDADLLGIPLRITIGEKNLKNGQVEIKSRKDPKSQLVAVNDCIETVAQMVQDAMIPRPHLK